MDSSITKRDPQREAMAAATAYAQAHAILEAQPGISATDLVERLRLHAAELAGAAGERVVPAVPDPRTATEREAGRPGLGAAAAAARENAPGHDGIT